MSARRIYVASSWRNAHQPAIVHNLRAAGHEVYDFRRPAPGNDGFHWSAIDPNWQEWTPESYRNALASMTAVSGFGFDFRAMDWADTCVLVLPSGRSAHIEAGWMAGQGKAVYVLMLEKQEPELMYRLCAGICISVDELLDVLVNEPVLQ